MESSSEATPESIRSRILDIISEQGVIERVALRPEATLEDLGVQSIDVVMILNEIEEVFGIYVPIDQSLSDIVNVEGLVDHIAALVAASKNEEPSGAPPQADRAGE